MRRHAFANDGNSSLPLRELLEQLDEGGFHERRCFDAISDVPQKEVDRFKGIAGTRSERDARRSSSLRLILFMLMLHASSFRSAARESYT
jgi:hypothetical protein